MLKHDNLNCAREVRHWVRSATWQRQDTCQSTFNSYVLVAVPSASQLLVRQAKPNKENSVKEKIMPAITSSSHLAMSVTVTSTPAIKNAPLVGLAEGNGYFSNYQLAGAVIVIPWLVKRVLPVVSRGGFKTYLFLVVVLGIPITVGYWTLMSMYGRRKNMKVELPGKDIEEYITITDPELKAKFNGKEKIPMQVFHDAYFDGKIEFNGT